MKAPTKYNASSWLDHSSRDSDDFASDSRSTPDFDGPMSNTFAGASGTSVAGWEQ